MSYIDKCARLSFTFNLIFHELYQAARDGDLSKAKSCITRGADIEFHNKEVTVRYSCVYIALYSV